MATEPMDGDRIEVSPSGRATCRTCRAVIEKGALRFVETADLGQRYHHLECGAKKLPKRVLPAIEKYEGEVPDRAALVALASNANPSTPGNYPYAEVAKTGRSSCIACRQAIPKDTLRIAVERQVETPQGTMPRPGYYHLACAKGAETVTSEAVVSNTSTLTETQTEELKAVLGSSA